MNDPIFWALIIALGVTMAWVLINFFLIGSRAAWRQKRRIRCFFGNHISGPVRGEVGGRNVQRCLYCDKVVYQYTVTKGSIRRTT